MAEENYRISKKWAKAYWVVIISQLLLMLIFYIIQLQFNNK